MFRFQQTGRGAFLAGQIEWSANIAPLFTAPIAPPSPIPVQNWLIELKPGSPVIGTPAFTQNHVLSATNLTVASPQLASGAGAVVRTDVNSYDSGGGFGSGPFTTASFTPADNSLLVVCVVIENVPSNTVIPSVTVAGGSLTFTDQRHDESLNDGADYSAIWTAPVGVGASMTLTLDVGAESVHRIIAKVFTYTGYDTVSPIGGVGGIQNVDGADPTTFTLSSSPAAESEVIVVGIADGSGAGNSIVAGTGWTGHFISQPDLFAGVETRTGSTSSTVTWNQFHSSAHAGVASSAIEIKAKAGGPALVEVPGGIAAANLTVGSPVLGAPNLICAVATPLTVGSPVLGTPNVICAVAAGKTVGSPVLGAPNVVNTVAAGLTVGSPVLGSPNVVNTVPAALTVGSPVLDTPTLVLSSGAAPLTVGSPVLGAPNLVNTVPIGLTVSSPVLGAPAGGYNLAATSLAVGSPVLGVPNVVNTVPVGLAVSSPVLGAPALLKTLTATNLTVGSPVLGAPALTKVLPAANLTVSSPVLGSPNVVNTVPVGLTVGSPVLPAPTLGIAGVMIASPLAVSSPVLGTPNLINTKAANLVVGSPVLGAGVYGRVLAAAGLTVASPALGAPSVGQRHFLATGGLPTGSPVLGSPILFFAGSMGGIPLIVASPVIGRPAFRFRDHNFRVLESDAPVTAEGRPPAADFIGRTAGAVIEGGHSVTFTGRSNRQTTSGKG